MFKIMMMILSIQLLMINISAAGSVHEFRMSIDDTFRVTETDDIKVVVGREMPLRVADVNITPKRGYNFNMMLYFKCDTPDLAQFNTPGKIAWSVRVSSEKYLPSVVEKKIELQSVPVSYGSFVVLTDKKSTIPPGEYKYITRGMVRLSKDSALGFSLMTNDITSPDYKKLMGYIFGFVRKSKGPGSN